jgi:hypothetical protein
VADDLSSQELIGRTADEKLLAAGAGALPPSVGSPPPQPAPPPRSPLIAAGVALTGGSLVVGIALVVIGLIGLVAGHGLALAALLAGLLLAATHWGWVHVATWLSDRHHEGHRRAAEAGHDSWRERIEPYTRYEVSTIVGEDGAITIETVCYRPRPASPGRFTFTREPVASEVHASEEPAAAIAERAELLRRQAVALTAQARQRYAAAVEAYDSAQLRGQDEQEQVAAARAASQALSEQINAKLREPPLVE